jgi:hypothetical protein
MEAAILSKALDMVLKWAYSANSWKIRASERHAVSAVTFDSSILQNSKYNLWQTTIRNNQLVTETQGLRVWKLWPNVE